MNESAGLRGQASRALLAIDARWAKETLLSAAAGAGDASWSVPLLVGHHVVRIIYEGERLLRMPETGFGIPELAALLDSEHSETTGLLHG